MFNGLIKPRSFSSIVIITFFIIFGAAGFVSYHIYENMLRHTINENKSTAIILSNLIYEHQKAAIGILQSYTNRPAFVDAVKKKESGPVLSRFESLKRHHPEIDALFLTDAHGTLWANYPVDESAYGKNFAFRDWYKGVSKNWRPYISTVYRRVVLEKGLAAAIVVPVFDEKGNTIGIVGCAQRTDFLSNLIKSNRLNPDKNITLVDQEGNVIYSDVEGHEKEIIKCTHYTLIQNAIKENKNTIEAVDHLKNNVEEILAFSPVKDIGWTVIIGESKKSILKSHITDFVIISSFAFLIFLCITAALLLLQRDLKYRKTKEILEKEMQLRESEDKFRVLAESTPTAIMMYQNDKWVYANPAAEKISGYTLKELGELDFWAFVHPDYVDFVKERGQKRQKGEPAVNRYEFKIISKDGTEKWVDLSGASTILKGNPAGIISVLDITDRKRADEKIKQVADEWTTTFDSINDLISIQDNDFKIIRVNKAYAQALKTSPDELIGKRCHDVIHASDCPIPNCPFKKTLKGKTPYSEEIFEPNLGMYLEISTFPVFNAKGEITGSVHVAKNISERKKAEDLIRISEDRYRNISDLTSDYVFSCVRAKDTAYMIDWVAGALEKITGYTDEELISRGCWLTLVHPEDVDRVNEFLLGMEPGESDVCEFRIITKDGRVIWISDYIKCIEHESLPGHYRLLGASKDITERKEMEKTIKQSETKYRSIFENAMLGIFQSTPDGRLISVNPALAYMHGFASPEEMVAEIKDVRNTLYVDPNDRIRYMEILNKQDVVKGFETQFYRKNKEVFWVSMNVKAYRNKHGDVLFYEGIVEDITARKHSEEKLRKSLIATIKVLSSTVESRDPYTAGHQRKTASLARAIAQKMGLSNDVADNIRMAGNIHDIGKISIPAEILAKPGNISKVEMALIRIHPSSGYDILKDAELPYPIAEIVLQHHERLDGSGYPRGLKNGEILLEAQILAVADVVEAISSHRPYRPALGIEAALSEIEKNKGILYNEEVVEACLKLFKEEGFKFEAW